MFDAWAHDGDPLRRIFLESLIREIDPQGNNEALNSIKDKITGRKKTIKIKAKKSTSRLGKFISLSALLIPLGSALLNKVKYDQLVAPWSENSGPYFTFILGLLLCLAPILVLIYWFFKGDRDSESNRVSWEFFRVDSQEDYTQDITEDGERTSIEFEDFFKQIITTSINQNIIKKFIIVIDNLDRVTPEHAKNVWSTLQTFFQRRSTTNNIETWPDQVWFIVPFDREGFIKIWQSTDSDKKVPDSFLKKCFQLVAEVPHPVMSGWSQYVGKCIELALEKWPFDEKQKVVSTYIRYASRLDKSPTPRDIRIFVNQVGLLGAMWGNQTSVEAMCLYVLFKEKISTDALRLCLITNDLPDNYQPDIEKEILLPQIAGLVFGVDSQKGLQLLLGPEIHAAFKTGDGDGLLKLLTDHGNAFWIAYESSRNLWYLHEGDSDEYKTSFTKAFYFGLFNNKEKLKRDIENLRNIWINSYTNITPPDINYSESLNYTFKLCNNIEFLKEIKDITAKKIASEISRIDSDNFSINTITNILPIISFLKANSVHMERLLYNKLTHGNWILWLQKLNSNNISLDIVLPKKQAITGLATDVQFNSTNINIEALRYLIQTYNLFSTSDEWEGITNQINDWLKGNQRSYDCEELYNFATNLSISKNSKISKSIIECVKSSAFWNAGKYSSSVNNPSLPILSAIAMEDELQDNPDASPDIKSFWQNTNEQAIIERVYDSLEKLKRLDLVWILSRDPRNITATKIIDNFGTSDLYSQAEGVQFIDEFTWADEQKIMAIAQNLVNHGAFVKNHSDMKDRALIYQEVYAIFYKIDDPDTSAFIDSELNKINKDDWYKCLELNSPLVNLVGDKNPHFSDALCCYLIDLSIGKEKTLPRLNPSIIPNLLSKVTDLDITFLPKVINAYFNSSQDNLNDLEFDSICSYFSNHIKHIKHINDINIMERINYWIDNNKYRRIDWLISLNIKFNEHPLESLTSRLQLSIASEDSAKVLAAEKICNHFNFNLVEEGQEIS